MNAKNANKMRALFLAAQDMYIKLHGRADNERAPDLRAAQHQRAIFDAAEHIAELLEKAELELRAADLKDAELALKRAESRGREGTAEPGEIESARQHRRGCAELLHAAKKVK